MLYIQAMFNRLVSKATCPQNNQESLQLHLFSLLDDVAEVTGVPAASQLNYAAVDGQNTGFDFSMRFWHIGDSAAALYLVKQSVEGQITNLYLCGTVLKMGWLWSRAFEIDGKLGRDR